MAYRYITSACSAWSNPVSQLLTQILSTVTVPVRDHCVNLGNSMNAKLWWAIDSLLPKASKTTVFNVYHYCAGKRDKYALVARALGDAALMGDLRPVPTAPLPLVDRRVNATVTYAGRGARTGMISPAWATGPTAPAPPLPPDPAGAGAPP